MGKYVITLVGGIGNIIQTIPLMHWLKSEGHEVIAHRHPEAYCDEICEMASPSYHELILSPVAPKDGINKGNMMTTQLGKRLIKTMPEWAAWFVFHGFDVPESVETPLLHEEAECPSSIILAPCCKPNWPMKRWPHWQELADRLPGCAVVGLPGDGDIEGDFIDLRGKTSLKRLAGLLASAEYVVAEEGGIAHLACAVGTKTYIIYGGTNPVKNAQPNNAIQLMSSKPFACRPCQERSWYYEETSTEMILYGCRKNELIDGYARCMDALTEFEVLKAIADHGDRWSGDFRR